MTSEEPGAEHSDVVTVTPVTDGLTGGPGHRVDIDERLDRARTQAVEILFTVPLEGGTQAVDCRAPGFCRRAIYLACADGAFAEVIEPAHRGPFTALRPEEGWAREQWATMEELQTRGEEQVVVSWRWAGAGFERQSETPQTTPTPSVSLEEAPVGMPAISSDGRRVASMHSWGTDLEGQGANYIDLRVHRVRDGRVIRTIRLYGENEDGEPSLSPAAASDAVRRANALLSRGHFRAMTPLRSFHPHEHPIVDASGAGVRLVHRDGTLRVTGLVQAEHTPAGAPASAYCCGLEDDSDDDAPACELLPEVDAAWADAIARVILVSHHVSSATSGCEGIGSSGLWMHRSSRR